MQLIMTTTIERGKKDSIYSITRIQMWIQILTRSSTIHRLQCMNKTHFSIPINRFPLRRPKIYTKKTSSSTKKSVLNKCSIGSIYRIFLLGRRYGNLTSSCSVWLVWLFGKLQCFSLFMRIIYSVNSIYVYFLFFFVILQGQLWIFMCKFPKNRFSTVKEFSTRFFFCFFFLHTPRRNYGRQTK